MGPRLTRSGPNPPDQNRRHDPAEPSSSYLARLHGDEAAAAGMSAGDSRLLDLTCAAPAPPQQLLRVKIRFHAPTTSTVGGESQ